MNENENGKIRKAISSTGGRRFVMVLGNAAISTYLLMAGYISDAIYRDLIIATTAVYIGASTAEKFRKGMQNDD